MNSPNQFKPNPEAKILLEVTPTLAAWKYLSFRVLNLQSDSYRGHTGECEMALVPLSGEGRVEVSNEWFHLRRESVFTELPEVLYLPPNTAYAVETWGSFAFAEGGAPAEGTLPVRLFKPDEMRKEMRGGANATRQVNHILGPDLPAERLLLYEVYTPSGFWSGWPPHRHDGQNGSLRIEETYYYKIMPGNGWAIHRNYSPEDGFDELLLAQDGDLILAPKGYHPVAAAPGSNVYYLNFMAGEAANEARARPPVDDPAWGWMRQDWAGQPMDLPFGTKKP